MVIHAAFRRRAQASSPELATAGSTELRLLAVVLWIAAGCSTPPPPSRDGDIEALGSLHETILQAHRDGSPTEWLALEDDTLMVGNRGSISFPAREERRASRQAYLASTRFVEYADRQAPIVAVSDDGTMGWVMAEIVARGSSTADDGTIEPVEFFAAWIELYRKEDGTWKLVGNVSNFR